MKKQQLESVLKTAIMLFLLFGFGGVMGVFYSFVVELSVLSLSFLLLILGKAFYMKKKILITIFFSFFFVFLSAIVTKTEIYEYKGVFLRILTTALIITSFKNNYNNISIHLIKAIEIVMILALINVFLFTFFPMLFNEKIAEMGYRVKTIAFIFNDLGALHSFGGGQFHRNQGIFWEPGILQIVINILIFYRLFQQEKTIKSVLLPMFIILTTASTTGYIVLFIILISKYAKFSGKSILGFILVALITTPILITEIEHKFKGEGSESSFLRTYDTLIGMQIALSHPLTGIGMNKEKYEKEVSNRYVVIEGTAANIERGNTNSIILLCLYFGIPVTVFLLYMLYNQTLFKNKRLFFIIMIICLSSEPLPITGVVFLLLMSAIKIGNNELKNIFNKKILENRTPITT